MDKSLIRNFSIIAHIDHGKSTLADRILEYTGAIDKRHFHDQILDDMDLERERGITIKASAVRLNYQAADGKDYIFNLIDTPGHVDFTYEVSKSLAACEGALLVVDASQGIEAQTVANFYLAQEFKLQIIPVINKVDILSADVSRVKKQIVDMLKFNEDEIILASAKESIGIEAILERIVKVIPYPSGSDNVALQAFIFDSSFDTYKGVVVYLRIVNGIVRPGMVILTMQTKKEYKIEEVGVFKGLKAKATDMLSAGEVGYIAANIRDPREIIAGDTITELMRPSSEPLKGYRKLKPLVFCGVYPVNVKDFSELSNAMEKLRLSDAAFVYEPESSISFGYGFRCGFLGLLHMEIVQERLEREYNLNLILTTPNVAYRVKTKKGELFDVDNPARFPRAEDISEAWEPFVRVSMMIPSDTIESACELAKSRRGVYSKKEFFGSDRAMLEFIMPLCEIIVDFYDRIKSISRGYGSLDYEFEDYLPTKLVRLDILLNGQMCEAFSSLVYKEKAQAKGRILVEKLKEFIPRQLFEVNIQAAIGSQIIASEKIRSLGKHVTGKCYGGDITRKRKLWEKQKMGKKRLKQFGKVEIPQEAFLEVLKI